MSAVIERSTSPPKHARVCSSRIDTIFTGRPSSVESNSVRRIRGHRGHGRVTDTFAAPPLRHPQPFLPPQALHLLVIHPPPLIAGVVIGATAPLLGRVFAQRRSCARNAASGSEAVCAAGGRRWVLRCCPGHPAGEPFTHPEQALQVSHGRPPAFRV